MLEEQKGKIVVLEFWASWSGPCVAEMPRLIQAFANNDPGSVEFIAVNQAESSGHIQKFIQSRNWEGLKVALDSDQTVSQAFGLGSVPAAVIIDQEGRVITVKEGTYRNRAKELYKTVRLLLLH